MDRMFALKYRLRSDKGTAHVSVVVDPIAYGYVILDGEERPHQVTWDLGGASHAGHKYSLDLTRVVE